MINYWSLGCFCQFRVLSATPFNLNKNSDNIPEQIAVLSNTSASESNHARIVVIPFL